MHTAINILVLVVLCTQAAAAGNHLEGLQPMWTLPLGLGPVTLTGADVFAADATTVYATNTRGVVFAVRASDGEVLWSTPSNAEVFQLTVFREIPDTIYVASSLASFPTVSSTTVSAFSAATGAFRGQLLNVTPSESHPGVPLTATGNQSIALLHEFGVMVVDQALNPIWQHDQVETNASWMYYGHVASNEHLVASLAHNTAALLMRHLLVFDSRTGAVVCNISNVTDVFNAFAGVPFFLTPNNYTLLWNELQVAPRVAHITAAIYDLQHCTVDVSQTLSNIVNQAFLGQVFVLPTANGAEVLYNVNLTNGLNGTWQVWAFNLGAQWTDIPLWMSTVDLPNNEFALFSTPQMGTLPFSPEVVVLWCSGYLTALNASTGATVWQLAHRIPIGPPSSSGQFLFPLGGGRVLVPNLVGYVIINIHDGTIDTVVERGVPFWFGVSFQGGASRTPFVVVGTFDGELVAVQ